MSPIQYYNKGNYERIKLDWERDKTNPTYIINLLKFISGESGGVPGGGKHTKRKKTREPY